MTGEGGYTRTFFERAALWGSRQGLEQVEEIREKTGKGVKINSEYCMGWELGIVQDLCWKGAVEPSEALCCWLGRCCFDGKAAWHTEEGDFPLPREAGERAQDCVMSCTVLLTLQQSPSRGCLQQGRGIDQAWETLVWGKASRIDRPPANIH